MLRHRGTGTSVLFGGAGGGGLAAAVGCAECGHFVMVLELCREPFSKQSGCKGGQARRHSGAYYANAPRVAGSISREDTLLREVPGCIVPVEAYYFIPEAAQREVTEGWTRGGVWFERTDDDLGVLSRKLRAGQGILIYRTRDQVIDTGRLRRYLTNRLQAAGGQLVCDAEIIDAERSGNRVTTVIARTPEGRRRFPCDFFVNATGASLARVAARVSPWSDLGPHFELSAAPVLRLPWPFAQLQPCVLQCYGGGFLEHLSMMPVGHTERAAVCTRGGHRVEDPDRVPALEDLEHERILGLLSEAFALKIPRRNDHELNWCVKSLLTDPSLPPGGAAARLVSVIPGGRFGGLDNELYGSPGKLGSVLHFRDDVVRYVNRYFGGEERRAA